MLYGRYSVVPNPYLMVCMISNGGGSSQSTIPLTVEQRRANFNEGLSALFGINPTRDTFDPTHGRGIDNNNATEVFNSNRDSFIPNSVVPTKDNLTGVSSATSSLGNSAATGIQPNRLQNGDYDALQQSLQSAQTAPLERLVGMERIRTNEDLNKRGLFDSGVATRAQQGVTDQFLPQFTSAIKDAEAKRYGLQSQDNTALNDFLLKQAGVSDDYRYKSATAQDDFNLKKAAGQNQYGGSLAALTNANSWKPLEFLANSWNGTNGNITVGSSNGGWGFL